MSATKEALESLARELIEWRDAGGAVNDVVASVLGLIDTRIMRHGEINAEIAAAIVPETPTAADPNSGLAELADWMRMRNEAMAVATGNRDRINALEAALNGMMGLVQLLSRNEDIPVEIRARMTTGHRFKDAQLCFPDTKWDEYGLTAPETPAAADPNNGLPEPSSFPPMPPVVGNMSGTARLNIAKVFQKLKTAGEKSNSDPEKN